MKYRNQFMKYQLHCIDEPGAGGGGGGNPGGEPGSENNNDAGLSDHSTLWDNESTETPAPAVQLVQQPAAQPLSAAESFDKHVAGIDFGSNPEAMMAAVRDGNVEGFAEQLVNMQKGIYKAAMLDANKMMQQTTGNLKTEMQNNTETVISSDKLISQMNGALPFTAEPAYAPMAKAVLTRLLSKKDMTPEKAIKETGEYFSNMSKAVGGNMNGNLGNNQHSNSNNQFGDATQNEDMDWVQFMGGKPE